MTRDSLDESSPHLHPHLNPRSRELGRPFDASLEAGFPPGRAGQQKSSPSSPSLRARHGDGPPLARIAAELASGVRPDADNVLGGLVEAPRPDDIATLPPLGSPERARLTAVGEAAIRRGEVGVVVLGGGMATRFGGVVKALVPVADGLSFLGMKLADVLATRRRLGASVPFFCMTSFATHGLIASALAPHEDTLAFQQFDAIRLAPDGSTFLEDDGTPSRYATGHGDLPFALRERGVLEAFRARGGKTLLVSNVDNLTATLDPAVIGVHVENERSVTVEVAPKWPGDRGGAPARVNGVLQIVESFRFPPTFNQDSIPVFNTNTLVIDAEALEHDLALTWFAVTKTVSGRTAWQLERLVGELTATLPSCFLRVEREGPDARFQPIKEVDDLPRQAPVIVSVLRARGAV